MSANCGHDHGISGDVSTAYKAALWAVVVINVGMALVEIIGGGMADSMALQADALDFIADGASYGLSLAVVGAALAVRARVAYLKGISLLLMAITVLGLTSYRFIAGSAPDAPIMSGIGLAAFAANVVSVLILLKWKDGDANMRAVWLCSRNDAIGNLVVIGAAGVVYLTGSHLPDLIAALIMATLFFRSSLEITRRARIELKHAKLHKDGTPHDPTLYMGK